MTKLQQVNEETMRFMRGKYALDEIGNGVDELNFCEKDELIFTIRIHDDRYTFQIGDASVDVADLEALEVVKNLIMAKKAPNRKPFPKDGIIDSNCGHRCDLCVHNVNGKISESHRKELKERFTRVYGENEWHVLCNGCHSGGVGGDFGCPPRQCIAQSGIDKCINCTNHPCSNTHAGLRPEIHTRTIYAEDVTWTILPFVHKQYGN